MDATSIRPLRLVVVDESEAFLASVRHWIGSRGDVQLVGTACNADGALVAVADLSPDLMIVEAVLPGIDGFRLTRTLKATAGAPLVVIVTFHASVAARDEAFAAGADGFLAKAEFSDELDALLRVWRNDPPSLADRSNAAGPSGRVRTPATRGRRESRTGRDP
jgi:DNA-binding NarL/FixJ family response regulator